MKKYILPIIGIMCLSGFSICQELPVFSHSTVNSFLYNPSLAGSDFDSKGTIYLVHKHSFSSIGGHPVLSMISGNIPVNDFHIGIGGNIFYEKVNVLQTIYGSAAFSYHLLVDRYKRLSLGLSADMYYMGLNHDDLKLYNESLYDPIINEYENGKMRLDFSAGFNYQTERLAIGGTINSLRATIITSESEYSNYHSAYIKYSIPVFYQRDLIEPMITYRSIPFSTPQGSFGLYYSYKKQNTLGSLKDGYLIVGASINTNLSAGMTAGIRLLKRTKLFYNFESAGKYHKYLGYSNEITLRFDNVNLNYIEQGREYHKWNQRRHLFHRWLRK